MKIQDQISEAKERLLSIYAVQSGGKPSIAMYNAERDAVFELYCAYYDINLLTGLYADELEELRGKMKDEDVLIHKYRNKHHGRDQQS